MTLRLPHLNDCRFILGVLKIMVSWTFEIEPDDAEVGDPYGPVQKSRSKGSCSALEQLYMVNTWLIYVNIYQLWS